MLRNVKPYSIILPQIMQIMKKEKKKKLFTVCYVETGEVLGGKSLSLRGELFLLPDISIPPQAL